MDEYKRNTNIGVLAGIVLQIFARVVLLPQGGTVALLAIPVALAGTVCFIWGCWNYALSKGYPGYVGLLGLFSCLGLIILVLLPDKS